MPSPLAASAVNNRLASEKRTSDFLSSSVEAEADEESKAVKIARYSSIALANKSCFSKSCAYSTLTFLSELTASHLA